MAEKRPRHQGRSQRAQSSAPLASIDHASPLKFDSILGIDLLQKWSWGTLSSTEVQETCYKSYQDQVALLESLGLSIDNIPSLLHKLAKLGDWGNCKGSIKRDLLNMLGEPDSPKFVMVWLRVWKTVNNRCQVGRHLMPFMLPHMIMSHLWDNDRRRFDYLFFGGPYNELEVTEFWKQVVLRKDPRIIRHPMCQREGWYKKSHPDRFALRRSPLHWCWQILEQII